EDTRADPPRAALLRIRAIRRPGRPRPVPTLTPFFHPTADHDSVFVESEGPDFGEPALQHEHASVNCSNDNCAAAPVSFGRGSLHPNLRRTFHDNDDEWPGAKDPGLAAGPARFDSRRPE